MSSIGYTQGSGKLKIFAKKNLSFFFAFPVLSGKFGSSLQGSAQQKVSFLTSLAFLYQNENPRPNGPRETILIFPERYQMSSNMS